MCYANYMNRRYDSSRRKKAAEQTREEILRAALKLHWQGNTEFVPLAREAGCSVATLRKYFPSKEELFKNCTQTFAATVEMPDLQKLGGITDETRRIKQGVSELCRIHEVMFGYAWLGAHQRKNSPTLDSVMNSYEGLADAITEIITPSNSANTAMVRGLLDFLTYRALRLSAQLTPEDASTELVTTLQLIFTSPHKAT